MPTPSQNGNDGSGDDGGGDKGSGDGGDESDTDRSEESVTDRVVCRSVLSLQTTSSVSVCDRTAPERHTSRFMFQALNALPLP